MCAFAAWLTVCGAMATVLRETTPIPRPDRSALHAVVALALRRIHRRAARACALVDTDVDAATAATIEIGDLVVGALEQVRLLVDALASTSPARQALADDVHDSLGHTLSLAGVLAGTARATIVRDPRRAGDALEQVVIATARAVDELTAWFERPAMEPLTVDRRSLAEQLRDAPDPLVVRIDEDALAVAPEPVKACAGRIVRESLTNARRHAPGAPVGIGVSVSDDELVVVVANAPAPCPRVSGNRRGLAGLRRRAHAVGGQLDAASTPTGGFRVQAHLPLGARPPITHKDQR